MATFLDVPEGRLAYSDVGAGPLIIAIPGTGDLASGFQRGRAACDCFFFL
jgi:hypothetical protein